MHAVVVLSESRWQLQCVATALLPSMLLAARSPLLLLTKGAAPRCCCSLLRVGTRRPDVSTTTKPAPHSTNSSLIAPNRRSQLVCTTSDHCATPWPFMQLVSSLEVRPASTACWAHVNTRRPDLRTTTKVAPRSTNSTLIAQNQRSWHVCTASGHYARPWPFVQLIPPPEVSST